MTKVGPFREDAWEVRFHQGDNKRATFERACRVKVERALQIPVSKDFLRGKPGLAGLSIFRMPRPTVSRVKPREAKILNRAINDFQNKKKLPDDAYLRRTRRASKKVLRRERVLSNQFSDWLRRHDAYAAQEHDDVDISCDFRGETFFFELKICETDAAKYAIRDAVGQLLDYGFYPRRAVQPDWLGVVLSARPAMDDIKWVRTINRTFNSRGKQIEIFWSDGERFRSAGLTDNPLARFARPPR